MAKKNIAEVVWSQQFGYRMLILNFFHPFQTLFFSGTFWTFPDSKTNMSKLAMI